jgi:putative CocE/NonD family hydrolase
MNRLHLIVWFALASVGVAAHAAEPFAPYDSPAIYDGLQETSQYLRSFDGTRIAITIRRPTKGGQLATEPMPVIVTQDRSMSGRPETLKQIRYFTDRGYAWVAQDRRGAGASFGVQTGFVNQFDAKDAKAVIEWAGAQSFSNENVVALGCSNQAAWQYLVATLDPKYLVAIVPACASPQFFDHAVAINGIPVFPSGPTHYDGKCASVPAAGARPPGAPAGFTPPPPRKVDEDVDGSMLEAARAEQKCGASMLGQYWLHMPRDGLNRFANYRPAIEDTAMSHSDKVKSAGIAILQIGGWFDAAVAGQIEGQRHWGGRLIMGPWIHGNRPGRDARLPNASVDLDAQMLRWFDFHAKGVRNGADQPAITYYTVHALAGQEWREATAWPPKAVDKTRLYFSANGLSRSKPTDSVSKVDYVQQDVRWFDGGYQVLARSWSGDMSTANAKCLVHTLEPLERDTEVTGTPTARLWVSADTRDANVFAVIEDVAPDGRSTYVTDGRLRASWRKLNEPSWGTSDQAWHRGFEADVQPLIRGEPTELVFDFFPLSYVFKQGHRVRVSLSTSIGEAYQAPPLAAGKPVTLTLHRNAKHPSALDLPVISGL